MTIAGVIGRVGAEESLGNFVRGGLMESLGIAQRFRGIAEDLVVLLSTLPRRIKDELICVRQFRQFLNGKSFDGAVKNQ